MTTKLNKIFDQTEEREDLHTSIMKLRPHKNRITNEIRYMSILEAIAENMHIESGPVNLLDYTNTEIWVAIEETEAIKILFKDKDELKKS